MFDGTMLLLLIRVLVGLTWLQLVLLVLLIIILLHVLMLAGGRLLVSVTKGLQLVVILYVAMLRGWVLVPVGDRLLPMLCGAVGDVAAAGAGSWSTVLVVLMGKQLVVLLSGTPLNVLVVVALGCYCLRP
jgi:hypothetical protein